MASPGMRTWTGLWVAVAANAAWVASLGLLLSPLSDAVPRWFRPLGTLRLTLA